MSTTALVHLVAGPMGAGKTTFAAELVRRGGGVVFSIDDWMVALYGPDVTQPLDPAWMWERVRRAEAQILRTAQQVITAGLPIILDLGLQAAAQRSAMAAHWRSRGCEVRLHWLDADREERWRRVERRNQGRLGPGELVVSRAMFDYMEARCEAPGQDE